MDIETSRSTRFKFGSSQPARLHRPRRPGQSRRVMAAAVIRQSLLLQQPWCSRPPRIWRISSLVCISANVFPNSTFTSFGSPWASARPLAHAQCRCYPESEHGADGCDAECGER
ncbi:hypothetical protein FIBSPDRAFT_125844 [Athelia psychrophila]|uniref:Uncharacterized protein n=1 Tax=Athelia psychrophila TaxID=1759441 RepID=A0A166T769_9AGAM|nr:hypothetical protein FIBSPDRAFT_125844 [Fibularhizoctonia sp. CBS 109695]